MTVLFGHVKERDGDAPDGVVRIVSRGVHPSVDGVSMLAESEERFHIRDGEWETGELEPGDVTVRLELDGRPVVSWPVSIPAEGRHNLRDLLGVSAPEFDRALWEKLDARVAVLEGKPDFDPAPLERADRELAARFGQVPSLDAHMSLDGRVKALESKPEPAAFDPSGLEAADKAMGERLDTLEARPTVDLGPLTGRVEAIEEELAPPEGIEGPDAALVRGVDIPSFFAPYRGFDDSSYTESIHFVDKSGERVTVPEWAQYTSGDLTLASFQDYGTVVQAAAAAGTMTLAMKGALAESYRLLVHALKQGGMESPLDAASPAMVVMRKPDGSTYTTIGFPVEGKHKLPFIAVTTTGLEEPVEDGPGEFWSFYMVYLIKP